MSNGDGAIEVKRLYSGSVIGDDGGEVIAGAGLVTFAVTALIQRGDDVATADKLGGNEVPDARCRGEAVQQQDGWQIAAWHLRGPTKVVELKSISRDKAIDGQYRHGGKAP